MHHAYEEALKDYQQDMYNFCSRRGVGYLCVTTDMPIEKVLFGELLKAGIMS